MNEDALFTARLIRTAMVHLGVSQSELAKYLKSRGRISELLTGKRCPSKAEIAILRELLGLSADILIVRGDQEAPQRAQRKQGVNPFHHRQIGSHSPKRKSLPQGGIGA